jgi:hypothetical protein
MYGHWPEGVVCEHCVYKAKNTMGACVACGHEGVVPGVDEAGRPLCRSCSGITLHVDCLRCGFEGWLCAGELCSRCWLADKVDALLQGPDGTTPVVLQPLADAIKNMLSANSGVTWLRNRAVSKLLHQLALGEVELRHEALDALPASRTVEYIRGLLVQNGALVRRDERLATYQRWLETKLVTVDDAEQRRLIQAFGRWHLIPHLRQQAEQGGVTPNTFLRAKQSSTVAIGLLAWLGARGRTVKDWTQHDLDAWFSAGPSTRKHALPFVYWAMNTRRARRLRVPLWEPRTHPKLGEQQRLEALRRLLLDDGIALQLRVAGSLILLYGQPADRIAELSLDRVSAPDEDAVRVRLAADWVDVPEPLSTLVRAHLAGRPNMQTAANKDCPWLFPGNMPGRPMNVDGLVTKLRKVGVPVMATKTGAWQQFVREGPPSVLAEALGIAPVTAMRHAQRAGADWLRYAALRSPGMVTARTASDEST